MLDFQMGINDILKNQDKLQILLKKISNEYILK